MTELAPNIHEVHKEDTIRIEPVLRVTKKQNVLDSIVDIMRQLLYPSKNEPGPLVGPIQIPGSGRKIYLRLMEPVEASHVMVRFITQIPVPTADTETKPIFHFPPVIHPVNMLLHYAHSGHSHGHHIIPPNDIHFDSSNSHRTVHSPLRNISFNRAPGKEQDASLYGKTTVLTPSESLMKNSPGNASGTSGKDESLRSTQSIKTELTNTQVKPIIHEQQFSLDSLNSYYQHESAENIVKDLLNETTIVDGNDGTKTSAEPSYQLNTYRLPLRQIAPLYPLTSVQHADSPSSSYADTYKISSDILTDPSSYSSSSYEQYNDASSESRFTANSYGHQHHGIPNSYSTSYNSKPDYDHDMSSTFSDPYRQRNKFKDVSNSYSASYEYNSNVPSSYLASYETQNDLLGAASSYSSSYERDTVPSSFSSYDSSHEKQKSIRAISTSHAVSYDKKNDSQTVSNSHNALHIIDPPYFSSYPRQSSENWNANRSSKRTTDRPHHNQHNVVTISSVEQSGESSVEQTVWGKLKRQKNEPLASFQKSIEISSEIDHSHENWQPVIFLHKDAAWHETFANLKNEESRSREVTRHQQQQQQRPQQEQQQQQQQQQQHQQQQQQRQQQQQQQQQQQRQKLTDWPRETSSEKSKRRDQRQNSVRIAATRSPKCLRENENDRCERTKATTTSIPGLEKMIAAEVRTGRPIIVASKVIEMDILKLDDSTEISTMSAIIRSTTEKPSISTTSTITKSTTEKLSIGTTKSPTAKNITERPSLSIRTTKSSAANNIMEKSLPLIRTTKNPITNDKARSIAIGNIKRVLTSDTTEESSMENTTRTDASNKLLKRPMIMKKPTLIMKRIESSNTTQKPAIRDTTTKRILTTKKSKFRSAIARTKSNTT